MFTGDETIIAARNGAIIKQMRPVLFAVLTFLIFSTVAIAQNNPRVECPALRVVGPTRVLQAGEMANFSAEIVPRKPEWNFKYHWYLSHGQALSGQGTSSIEAERPPSSRLTATVQIAGGPDDSMCPIVATESITWDVPPDPEKIGSIRGRITDDPSFLLNRIKSHFEGYPRDHLYIFLVAPSNKPDKTIHEREIEIDHVLTDRVDRARTTIMRAVGDEEITEFWGIPPGANNPKCEACRITDQCPKISVIGPAGIWLPGDRIWFLANVEANHFANLRYSWQVDKGRIEVGQGTARIAVVTPQGFEQSIIATVEISGLPLGCPSQATESTAIAIDNFEPILIRKIKSSNYSIPTALLSQIGKSLRENPNSQLYVALRLDRDRARKDVNRLIQRVLRQLENTKIDRARITIVPTRNARPGFAFWQVPPGRSNPTVVPYIPQQ